MTSLPNLEEITRIRKVSDLMVTAHAIASHRLWRLSFVSDILLFICSVLLTAVVFLNPADLKAHVPFLSPFFIAVFSTATFILSFICNSLDWKVRSERHAFAKKIYSGIKLRAKEIIENLKNGKDPGSEQFLSYYRAISPQLPSIPEKLFLKYKNAHAQKVLISKFIDHHPGACIWFLKIILCCRSNINGFKIGQD